MQYVDIILLAVCVCACVNLLGASDHEQGIHKHPLPDVLHVARALENIEVCLIRNWTLPDPW